MSKYSLLWETIRDDGRDSFILTFDEIAQILGCPLDHAFLQYKKELDEFGYTVDHISLKKKTIVFKKIL